MRRIGEVIDQLDLNGANEELTKELVALSTKHGILTQYTSFLADENTRPTELATSSDFSSNTIRARSGLERLQEESGASGVAQRSAKQDLKTFTAPAAPAATALPADGAEALARFGSYYREAETDRLVVTESVRQIGKDTLYKRGLFLCTPETAELFKNDNGGLKLELDKLGDKVKVIDRFSDDYFTLCSSNTADENRLLAAQQDGEQLLLNLRGQAYLIK
jgi:Ca-activated chloride channel family protein